MRARHVTIPIEADHSFSIRKDYIANINNSWHYHTEVELICFHKGTGTQFVGDHIKPFGPGDIVLIGKELPHYWRYDQLGTDNATIPYSTVIHFKENFMGDAFINLPELKPIKYILDKAKSGILIGGDEAKIIAPQIEQIYLAEGVAKLVALFECLTSIANLKQNSTLSSLGFRQNVFAPDNERLNNVYHFVLNNFKDKIHLEDVAAIAGLAPNSFCRYFKNNTGKTFSRFLTDIRIGYARKLILENRLDIKQVCFVAGFNNFSCFHKNFKELTGNTPKQYQQLHQLS